MIKELHVIVAVRGGAGAKRRCAELLGASDRIALTALMLGDLLSALTAAESVASVSVVTLTPELIPLVELADAHAIAQLPPLGLNEAFSQAVATVRARQGDVAMALLPADLPLLTGAELDAAMALLDTHDVVVAPSRDGGTGCVLIGPGIPFAPLFGIDSCRRHLAAAAASGLSAEMFESPGFRRDIDLPADVLELARGPSETRSARFLRERLR